jgi:serine/threonine protein kinase
VDLIGQTLGQYHIVEFIGAGGMASVYKAYQPSLDRYVAIKVLPAQHALTSGFKDRFILEARAVAQLSHPNILPIYDFGLEEDLSYFVMKYVPDRTLSHLMGRPMKLARVEHFFHQVAGALDHAHARGIFHRDIKPANMLLEGDWLLLADFGVAKITENSTAITSSGRIFGTPAYVSPEQAEGSPLDHRTDIYSLGIVLYEMVVGRVPFEDTTPMRVIFKHIYELPPSPRGRRPDLPEAIEKVILKALAKNPAERYQRAGELDEALHEAMKTASIRPAAPKPSSRSAKSKAGKRAAAAPRRGRKAKPAPADIVGEKVLVMAQRAASPGPQPAPPLKPRRSVSSLGLTLVGGALFLLLIIGVFIFFAGNGAADDLAAGFDADQILVSTPITAGTSSTISSETPISASETSLVPANAPIPESLPVISGILAIPVKLGVEFKVYVTGFDGAGMNGPNAISLGDARQPMFRRDGQAIVVNGALLTGVLRGIFVTDGRGQAPTPVNDRGDAYWPVWSPDGAEIMFVDLDRGRTLFRQSSRLASSATDFASVQINNAQIVGNNILWSDDNRLIFQGCANWQGQFGECGIWVMAANAPDPVRLTTNGGLPMDAKKGWLTYVLPDGGDWEIYLISLEGGEPRKLTDNESQDGLAVIAPDGQSVAYVSNESGAWAIWTITLNNNQKQKWFDFDPQRGTIDVNSWAEERMSWTE